MFTGLIEEIGKIISIIRKGNYITIKIQSRVCVEDLTKGDSIAVDGVCLTAVDYDRNSFSADVTYETLKNTTLSTLKPGDPVNLERAITSHKRLGGHFVQGHVEGVGRIISKKVYGETKELSIQIPEHLKKYIVEKGSIALNGVSLTVAEFHDPILKIVLIPETLKNTNLRCKKPGDFLNIETDILAKYVEKVYSGKKSTEILTLQKLKELGF